MSDWQGCSGCGNLIPVGGYEWCGGCRPEEQDDGGAAYWRERFEDMAARFARMGEQYDAHMLAVRPALARAWDDGARQGSRGVLPTAELELRNPYRDPPANWLFAELDAAAREFREMPDEYKPVVVAAPRDSEEFCVPCGIEHPLPLHYDGSPDA